MGIYLNLVGNDIVFFLLILVFYIFLKCVLYNKYCGMFNEIYFKRIWKVRICKEKVILFLIKFE